MSTYNQLIHLYKDDFKKKDLSLELGKAFLFELCNEYNVNLYLQMDNEANADLEKRFHEGVKRLLNDEPMNYVLGYAYFYGYKFKTNQDVLIPRPETEELVGLILSKYDEFYPQEKITLCDVGTGSGAIGISLKKEESKIEVYASDISEKALEVAKANAIANEVDITFLQGSMLEPYIERNLKFDILVSNPPYIKNDEILENSVKDYEPHVALFGGEDGLKFYREILKNAHLILKEHGLIFFEMGYDQASNLSDLARKYFKDADIQVYKDINRKDRMLMIKF